MSADPQVSFVVPCYNYGRYLGECLDSIFTIDGSGDFEVLVIDDASTDETPEVLASYTDPRLATRRHDVSLGTAACVAEGFAAARGEGAGQLRHRQTLDAGAPARGAPAPRDSAHGGSAVTREPDPGLSPQGPIAGNIELPVCVIHWNAPGWCLETVASILRTAAPVHPLVTVVDNGMRQGPSPLADRLPAEVRLLATGANRGYAGAANIALTDWRARHPESAYCVLTSHDVVVEPDTLAGLLTVARQIPEAGVVAPYVENGYIGPRTTFNDDYLTHADRTYRAWVSETFLLIRGACIDQISGFDERLFAYCEDAEFCERARRAGYAIVHAPKVRTTSHGTADNHAFQLYSQSNKVLYTARCHGILATLPSFWSLARRLPRHLVGSIRVWRSSTRRASSYGAFKACGAVMLRAARLLWRERKTLQWHGNGPDGLWFDVARQ